MAAESEADRKRRIRLDAHGIAAETIEPTGKSGDAILDASRERRVELIVVGSRQRNLVGHLLCDGLADELVVEAAADVLVVR